MTLTVGLVKAMLAGGSGLFGTMELSQLLSEEQAVVCTMELYVQQLFGYAHWIRVRGYPGDFVAFPFHGWSSSGCNVSVGPRRLYPQFFAGNSQTGGVIALPLV